MTCDPIRLGVAGLGRAFVLTLPSLQADARVKLVAAAAPRAESRAAFDTAFDAHSYASVDELAEDPQVEAIYIATPHQMHRAHALAAFRAGKHAVVDKPLAVTLADGEAMVKAAHEAGCTLIVGPSHSFDAPVALARQIIDSGEFGRLRMIQAFNYTDFLYRPRRPEELRTEEGGGVIFSQAVHQIDVVRLLAGGMATRVMAMTGVWDPQRPSEGAYAALMQFQSGVFATLTYSGYGHFDSDIWMDDVSELGHDKPAGRIGARKALASLSPSDERARKTGRTFVGGDVPPSARHHEHFGPVIALCEGADLRLTPEGVEIWADGQHRLRPAPSSAPRKGVVDALFNALRHGQPPVQSGAWGLASLEACHAILASAQSGQPQHLHFQIPTGAHR